MLIILLLLAGSSAQAGGWANAVKASLPAGHPGVVGIVAARLGRPDSPAVWLEKVGESLAASAGRPEEFARLPQAGREALVAAVLRGEDAALRAKAAPALRAYRREENDPAVLEPLIDDAAFALYSPFYGATKEEFELLKTAYDALKHTVLKSRWTGAYAAAETMAAYLGARRGGASADDGGAGAEAGAWRAGVKLLRRIAEFSGKDAARPEYEKLGDNPYVEAALSIEEALANAKLEGGEASFWVSHLLDAVNKYGRAVYADRLMPEADAEIRLALARQAVAWLGEAGRLIAARPAGALPSKSVWEAVGMAEAVQGYLLDAANPGAPDGWDELLILWEPVAAGLRHAAESGVTAAEISRMKEKAEPALKRAEAALGARPKDAEAGQALRALQALRRRLVDLSAPEANQ